jgi:choline dehydrogenase-like flavoprotein
MMMFLGRLVRPIPSAQNSNFFTKRNASSTPDYVVIGAGSAGCVVSSRLAEAGKSVTLLEAGSSDRASPTDLFVHMPTALAWPMSMERYNWSFKVRD